MEIALRTAGALLGEFIVEKPGIVSAMPDWAISDLPSGKKEDRYVDEFMGSIW
jgi:hypothetical protein